MQIRSLHLFVLCVCVCGIWLIDAPMNIQMLLKEVEYCASGIFR